MLEHICSSSLFLLKCQSNQDLLTGNLQWWLSSWVNLEAWLDFPKGNRSSVWIFFWEVAIKRKWKYLISLFFFLHISHTGYSCMFGSPRKTLKNGKEIKKPKERRAFPAFFPAVVIIQGEQDLDQSKVSSRVLNYLGKTHARGDLFSDSTNSIWKPSKSPQPTKQINFLLLIWLWCSKGISTVQILP